MTDFTTGGFTFSGAFVSEYRITGNSLIGNPCAQSPIITGEDGERYYIAGGVGGVAGGGDTLTINDAALGTNAITQTKTQLTTAIDAALGVDFLNNLKTGQLEGNMGSLAITIPDTPYILFMAGSAFSTDTSWAVVYAKINSGGTLDIVGGWSGIEDDLNVQFRPADAFGDSVYGAGHIIDSNFQTTGATNEIAYQYPIAIALFGETESTVVVVPSINAIIAAGTLTEVLGADVWSRKEDFLDGVYGSNILALEDSPPGVATSRAFFLPRSASGGSWFCQQFYLTDLEAHDAGSETTTNTFLDTNATTYVTGLISATQIGLFGASLESFGFTSALGSTTIPFHTKFLNQDQSAAFPYPDSTLNFDDTAGLAADNYYGNATVYPSSLTDATEPWFLFIPRLYRKAGEKDKVGVRIMVWTPGDEKAKLLDFDNGTVFSIGSEVHANTDINTANIEWNRTTGALTMLMRSSPAGEKALIVASVGTFVPVEQAEDTSTTSEELKVRAWTFNMDGHSFYVLRLGQQGTYIYDDRTQQWSEWATQGQDTWNADHGVSNWRGKPIAGDQTDSFLWEIDPAGTLDEDVNPITRTVTGIVSHRGNDSLTVAEARMIASMGNPDEPDAEISLRWSDDDGNTYSDYYTITMTEDDYEQRVSWRSLGKFNAPGRIFEIRDVGGMVRIDGFEIDIGED